MNRLIRTAVTAYCGASAWLLQASSPPVANADTVKGTVKGIVKGSIRGTVTAHEGEEITIKGQLTSNLLTAGRCILLPWNDDGYKYRHPSQVRFQYLTPVYAIMPNKSEHHINLLDGAPFTYLWEQHVIQLSSTVDALPFVSTVNAPSEPDGPAGRPVEFINRFYPMILDHCPTPTDRVADYDFLPIDQGRIDLEFDTNMTVLVPGLARPVTTIHEQHLDPLFAFALASKRNLVTSKNSKGIDLTFVYSDAHFGELIPSFMASFDYMDDKAGALPLKELLIIETKDFQVNQHRGFVTLNLPRSSQMNATREDVAHYRYWQAVTSMISQWYGAWVQVPKASDYWFITGTVDYYTERILHDTLKDGEKPTHYELFNPKTFISHLIQIDYLQIQEIAAGELARSIDDSSLVRISYDANQQVTMESRDFDVSHPFNFIKQTFALRDAQIESSGDVFDRAMSAFFATAIKKPLSPLELSRILPQSQRITTWWKSVTWPDFSLDELRKDQSGVKVFVQTTPDFPFGADVLISSPGQHKFLKKSIPYDLVHNLWVATFSNQELHEHGVDRSSLNAVVDPYHRFFDEDRFNNKSNFPSLKFMPGNTRMISDEDRTLIWAPYILRRPGEPVTLGVQSYIYRYLNSSTSLRVEGNIASQLFGFKLTHDHKIGQSAWHADGSARRNYDNIAQVDMGAYHVNVSPFAIAPLKPGIYGRQRSVLGDKAQTSESAVVKITSDTKNGPLERLFYLDSEYEHMVLAPYQKDRMYDRTKVNLSSFQHLPLRLDYKIRGFYGHLNHRDPDITDGSQPIDISGDQFKPNDSAECNFRFDSFGSDRTDQVVGLANDLIIPANFFAKDLGWLITEKTKIRLFADVADTVNPNLRHFSTGIGFVLPFGGDMAGSSSLAVMQASLMVIMYERAGTDEQRKPALFFDIGGDL